ncbi:hypothetical protein [Natrinema salsiterrestre]|uniref:Uncharacterized protein n=1 Tax=Natrinema salsiterrestre TaxID=2950540 RepID=A0A9Q4L4A0_9EURY|nr:hypothetical protein [Natrinema salsiterrestre]MDF9746262.1 hypothetical protein [Natrinema salsiterrestre]
MSGNKGASGVSRRGLLRKSAGTGLGVAGISQTAAAWETADPRDIKQIRRSSEVKAVLKELNSERLPKDGKTRTLTVDGRGEVTTTKVEFEFGTLRFGEFGDDRNANFTFDSITHPAVPSKFANIPEGTAPILIANGDDVTVSREATDRERDIVLSAVPERGDRATVSTRSDINGFRVNVAKNTSSIEDTEIKRYTVELPDSNFSPAVRDTSDRLEDGSELTVTNEVEIQGIKSKLIGDYVEGVIASNLGDELHECGSNCVGCADWIISLALDCRLCGPLCTSAASGAGAVLCGVCVYQFCTDVDAMVGCADCIACAVEGNSSWSSPTTPDIPEDIPGLGGGVPW